MEMSKERRSGTFSVMPLVVKKKDLKCDQDRVSQLKMVE